MNRIKTLYEKIKTFFRKIFPGFMKKLSRFRYRLQLKRKEPEVIFSDYYQKNKWGDKESISGPGSRLERTQKIRDALPKLARQFNISTVLDIPCGDFNWMRYVEWDVDYIGADIVQELIKSNKSEYGSEKRQFSVLNILEDDLPKTDLVICRDCLVHFSYDDIFKALNNLQKSRSTYLLTTTMIDRRKNHNIITGEFRAINFQKPPFTFPDPIVLLDDTYSLPSYYDKHLGLWKISGLKIR